MRRISALTSLLRTYHVRALHNFGANFGEFRQKIAFTSVKHGFRYVNSITVHLCTVGAQMNGFLSALNSATLISVLMQSHTTETKDNSKTV